MEDGFSVSEVVRLLGKGAAAIHLDKHLTHTGGRGSPFARQPVVAAHERTITELEGKLRSMRAAAVELGVNAGPAADRPKHPARESSIPAASSTATTITATLAGSDLGQMSIDRAVAQQEIDRLKSEIRDANRLISGLQAAIDAVRPREDLGLDEIP